MLCFNKKVLVGLGVVGLGVLALAPNLFASVLPLLVVAACPLSMLFMMRTMSRGGDASASSCAVTPKDDAGADSKTAEMARLRAEVERLRAEMGTAGPRGNGAVNGAGGHRSRHAPAADAHPEPR